MHRVTCRCGERLTVQPEGPERIDCPKCGAKIRLRHVPQAPRGPAAGDGFIRFHCPCGRRLKVPAADRPIAGKCPDCGRVVPVPTASQTKAAPGPLKQGPKSDPEARTEDLDAEDLARLDSWGARHTANPNPKHGPLSTATDVQQVVSGADSALGFSAPVANPVSEVKFEAGLRICPRCKKPVHLGAAICRECGTTVPRQ
jgi:DNA-directed RNA polymerase subunit RPC12/RpoP